MTKVTKKTVSKATSFFLILAGLFIVFFQKAPLRDREESLFGSQIAHADFGSSCAGFITSCQEGTCEGCSGCGGSSCGSDAGGCDSACI